MTYEDRIKITIARYAHAGYRATPVGNGYMEVLAFDEIPGGVPRRLPPESIDGWIQQVEAHKAMESGERP